MSADEPQDTEPKLSSLILSVVSGTCLGSVPGLLIAWLGPLNSGLAVMLIGIPIGIVMALGYAAPGNVGKLLVGTIVARNVPSHLHREIWDVVDQAQAPDEASEDASMRLLGWLLVEDVRDRRTKWVIAAIIAGALLGGLIAYNDTQRLASGKAGILLSPGDPKNSLATQGVHFTALIAIWTGALTGIFASAAFRRPILFAGIFAGYLAACIELAVADPTGMHKPGVIAVFFMTFAMVLTLIVTLIVSSTADDSGVPDTAADSGHALDGNIIQ